MIILEADYGRLANRLFVVAHFLAASVEFGHTLLINGFEYGDHFPGLEERARAKGAKVHCIGDGATSRLLSRGLRAASRLGATLEDPSDFDRLRRRGDREVLGLVRGGWSFREPEAFSRHRELILEVLQPTWSLKRAVERRMRRVRERADVVVGIHVRRGDYAQWEGGRFFFEMNVYERLMRMMADLLTGRQVAFVVTSDEEVSLSAPEGTHVYVPGGSAVEDLYTLAACDYIIGPPSTYSYWASYAGGVPLRHVSAPHDEWELEDFEVHGTPANIVDSHGSTSC